MAFKKIRTVQPLMWLPILNRKLMQSVFPSWVLNGGFCAGAGGPGRKRNLLVTEGTWVTINGPTLNAWRNGHNGKTFCKRVDMIPTKPALIFGAGNMEISRGRVRPPELLTSCVDWLKKNTQTVYLPLKLVQPHPNSGKADDARAADAPTPKVSSEPHRWVRDAANTLDPARSSCRVLHRS